MSNWKSAYGALETKAEVRGTHGLPPRSFSGQVLGIIAVKLDYPKLPGNVANACTFNYPVCYEVVDFEIEQLFAGDPAIKQMIIEAAKKLEAQGVRAIIGACGYFAHFQKDVAAAVDVPGIHVELVPAASYQGGLCPGGVYCGVCRRWIQLER